MLRELNILSRTLYDKELLSPLGFGTPVVHFSIDLDSGAIAVLSTVLSNGKTSFGQKIRVPEISRNGAKPLLIDDSAEYLFGAGSRGQERQKLYVDLLDSCFAVTQNHFISLIKGFIKTQTPESIFDQIKDTPQLKIDAWEKSRFVFKYEGNKITSIPEIADWWITKCSDAKETEAGICLVSGNRSDILKGVIPLGIKGVPGSLAKGAALVSFDKNVTESYGLSKNDNAPIGVSTAIATHKTLNFLLESKSNTLKLGSDSILVFWGEEDCEGINPEIWNNPSFNSIFSSPNKPQNLDIDELKSSQFYFAILKGNAGRISLVSWDLLLVEVVKKSLTSFITTQLTCGTKPSGIWLLCEAAFLKGSDEYRCTTFMALTRTALFGEPLPDNYAQKIVTRICVEKDFSYPKAQGLALYLASHNMAYPTENTRLDSAYQLGKISFLMHWTQHKATGIKEELTGVNRNLKTLSTIPNQVFAKLCQSCTCYHLPKAGYMQKLLTDAFAEFDIRELPDILDVKSQSMFFMGWYSTRSEIFTKKVDPLDSDVEKEE